MHYSRQIRKILDTTINRLDYQEQILDWIRKFPLIRANMYNLSGGILLLEKKGKVFFEENSIEEILVNLGGKEKSPYLWLKGKFI